MARALDHCAEVTLDGELARAAGVLCGRTQTSDVIDASVAITAAAASRCGKTVVVTSDRPDIDRLCTAFQASVDVVEP